MVEVLLEESQMALESQRRSRAGSAAVPLDASFFKPTFALGVLSFC